jgi:hypothetical protein
LPAAAIKQLLLTEVGAGIGWHRDKSHFDKVFGLSLASACKFPFYRFLLLRDVVRGGSSLLARCADGPADWSRL